MGGAAATWPLSARAQRPLMPTIGILGSTSSQVQANFLRAFQQGLGEAGYVERRDAAVEYGWADDQNEKLPALAADLVRRRINVIVAAASTQAAIAAKAATATIPIVFLLGSDPVGAGLVDNLARPGGNVTDVTSMNVELGSKRLELARELLQATNVIALLVNPTDPTITQPMSKDLQSAAHGLGLQLHILNATTEADFDSVFPTMSKLRTGRILKGEKPANLPVQQMAKLELVINLKTAKALGLTISIVAARSRRRSD